jgi:4'-phosphopantetheinyl transferase
MGVKRESVIYNYTACPGESLPVHRDLCDCEVHTWFFPLDADKAVIAGQRQLLTPDECRQMDRFRMPELTRRFTIARGMQRVILGAYCHARPEDVYFKYSPRGKPFLPGSSLQFNVSHSGDYGILAVAKQRQVGIDIECIRQISTLSIAKRFFMPEEYDYLASLPEAERQRTFFRIWTCKESFIKARGLSLSSYLSSVLVMVPFGESAPRVWLREGENLEDRWEVFELNMADDAVTALVVEKLEGTQGTVVRSP